MAFEKLGLVGLDYAPCKYGQSKLVFRGPKAALDRPYVAMMGGTETYGRFVEDPFAVGLTRRTGLQVANLGVANAGPGVYLEDPSLLDLCGRARATVIQISGAQTVSNRYFSVHPRRNDRFLKVSSLLATIYREVDFTEFHFVRHMLKVLNEVSVEKFAMVEDELRTAWMARMRSLIDRIDGPVVLLWLAGRSLDQACTPMPQLGQAGTGHDPLFITREMVAGLQELGADLVEVVADREEIEAGRARMVFSAMDAPAAGEMLGPVVHERVVQALAEAVDRRAP